MIKNCINCGAPIDSTKTKCPYCDTTYNLNDFTAEIDKDCRGILNIGGNIYNVYLTEIEIEHEMIDVSCLGDTSVRMLPDMAHRTFTFVEC